jgi:hypothetical protein
VSTALAQTNDDQVPFTAGGTGVLTGVTKLPGGLTRLNFIGSGNATHLEDYIAPAARIEDNQGTYWFQFFGKDTTRRNHTSLWADAQRIFVNPNES